MTAITPLRMKWAELTQKTASGKTGTAWLKATVRDSLHYYFAPLALLGWVLKTHVQHRCSGTGGSH